GAATTIDRLTFRNGYMEGDLRTNAKDQLYGGGGAIFAEAALTVKNSTFESNSYKDTTKTAWYLGGGAIFAIADVTVEGSTFTGNYVNTSAKSAYHGGSAIFIANAKLDLTSSSFLNHNTGTANGVVMSAIGNGMTVKDSIFTDNTTYGIYVADPSKNYPLTFTGSTFSNNKASYGAAINASTAGTLLVDDCTFSGNTSSLTYGGAVRLTGAGTFTISNSTFENNINTSNVNGYSAGGAVYYSGAGKLIISGSEFTGNQVTKATNPLGGGAIYANFSTSGSMTVTDSTFSGNSTGTRGGAIYLALANGSATITNSIFTGNSAATQGGAIYLAAGTLNVVNSTIHDNTAANGCSIQVVAGTVNLINSTLYSSSTNSTLEITDGVTFRAVNSVIAGTVVGTLSNMYSVIGGNSADLFESTTLTAQNTLAIKAEGAAATAGTLVGQKNGAFYYLDGSTWKKVGGTDADNLAFDAADTVTYGLTDGTILTLAQNGVSRILTLTAFNAGAHALELAPLSSVVNSLEDSINYFDDKITLREAIANYNNVSFSNQVDWSLTDKTIVLTMGQQLYRYGNFTLNGALTFNGTDQGRVTVKVPVTYAEAQADSTLTVTNHRAFQFDGGDAKWNHVQLSNIIVKGGYTTSGGAIYSKPNITMTNVTVADSGAKNGGGVCVGGNTLIMQNCFVVNNVSTGEGGGIYHTKSATYGNSKIENSLIAGNTAAGKQGAAIYIYCTVSATTQIINTTMADNTGKSAFYLGNQSSTLRVINSIIAGNAVTDADIVIGPGSGKTVTASLINTVYGTISTSATTLTESANLSGVTYADVFGTNTLTEKAGGTYELAVVPTGKAAVTGTLVASVDTGKASGGTVNKDYYYLDTATGKWMLNGADAGYTYDPAAANYGLGVKNAVILGTALNRDADGNFVSRLDAAPYSTFTAGAYALKAETAGTVVKVGTDNGFFNPFDGEITLRDAATYAGVGALGSEVTFDDALTEVVLTDTLTIGKDLTITDDNMKISGAALAVAESVTLTVSSGSKFEITEAVNNGTIDNKGALTLGTLSGTGAFVNNGTATVTGNLTQAGVTNNQSMTVSGNYETTDNTDNATGAELTVSGTLTTEDLSNGGTLTATGNIAVTDHLENAGTLTASAAFSATTTDNSGSLAVSGDFSGGAVNNTGSMTLSGTNNTATDATKLGNVTYDGATAQQVIAGTYAALILSGAGAKTATGNITANSVKNESETTVTGNLTATGTVENDANLTVNGNLSAGTTDNSSDLKVSGTYTADTTTNSATLDVNGNFAGGTVDNTGTMTLSGASNSGTGNLGNVTYDGADQQVIAGTYGNLTINSTGKASANGNIVVNGDLVNTAELTVDGNVAAASITTSGDTEVTGNL
ncbi:MAG: right-handed parallel beta-helix repeat-containing protein, partial [Lentisphaeria bacterium]|nr:right-handed parallel beta-helix repeat-containing protein [Lentisphaeria bacterium]